MGKRRSPHERAAAKQEKKLQELADAYKNQDKVWKKCFVCGQSFCINNHAEEQLPMFRGRWVCAKCDPRAWTPSGFGRLNKVGNKDKYMNAMSIIIVEGLAKKKCLKKGKKKCKCTHCTCRRLVKVTRGEV